MEPKVPNLLASKSAERTDPDSESWDRRKGDNQRPDPETQGLGERPTLVGLFSGPGADPTESYKY
jgi:hypothetical protein